MARKKPARQYLNVPFAKGLNQKVDPRLLQLGGAATATNVVADKAGRLAKAPGWEQIDAAPSVGDFGKVIAQNRGSVLTTAANNVNGQSFLTAVGGPETGHKSTFVAKIPEVNVRSPFQVGGGQFTYQSGDMAVYNPGAGADCIELYVFEVTGVIYAAAYQLDVAGNRFCIMPLAAIPALSPVALGNTNLLLHAPKVTLCGPYGVVTAMSVDTTGAVGPEIWASSVVLSAPANIVPANFITAVAVATTISLGNTTTNYPYGVAAVEDDSTRYLLVCQGTTSGHNSINVSRILASTNGTTTSGVFTDATWAAAGYPNITGFAIRGSTALSGAYFAYGYNLSTYPASGGSFGLAGTPSVYGGGLAMPGLGSAVCSVVSLLGGNSTNQMPPAPRLLDIKAVPGTSPVQNQVVWSPGPEIPIVDTAGVYSAGPDTGGISIGISGNTVPPALSGVIPQNGNPYAAIYQSIFYEAAGVGTVGANSVRWTNGATLASKMALVVNQTSGVSPTTNCYLVGYFPSHNPQPTVPTSISNVTTGAVVLPGGGNYIDIAGIYPAQATNDTAGYNVISSSGTTLTHTYKNIQGSYFLFAMDSFGDTSTSNVGFGANGPASSFNVPLRWCATLAPRQALSQITAKSYVLPTLAPTGIASSVVWETVLPVSVSSVQTVMTTYPLDFQPTDGAYAELGGLTGLALGVPLLTDGAVIEEFAYPYYPEHLMADIAYNGVGSTGQILSGQYQYMATYERIDASGARHRSGRSVPITVTIPTITAASFVSGANPFSVIPNHDGQTFQITDTSAGNRFTQTMAASGDQFITWNDLTTNSTTNSTSFRIVGFVNANQVIVLVGSNTFPTFNDLQTITIPMYAQVTIHVPNVGYSLSAANVYGGNGTPTTIQLWRTTAGGSVFYNTGVSAISDLAHSYTDLIDVTYDGDSGLASSGLYAFDYQDVPPTIYLPVPVIPATAGVSTNEECYGDGATSAAPGAILDCLTPPYFGGLVTHKNRWWGWSGRNVWYSKAFTIGEGPGFNEIQVFSVDDGPSDVTALASQDERLVIFKYDRLFYQTGDGPDDTGSNNDLQPPQRITADVGCVTWKSVVTGPMGTWFQSANGLYLLARGFEVTAAGKPVEDVLAAYPYVTSASIDTQLGRIYWTVSTSPFAAASASGGLIIYDYVLDVWSFNQPNGAAAPVNLLAATEVSNYGLVATDTNGNVWAQTTPPATKSFSVQVAGGAATYQNGTWQSPWIDADKLQGFGHWWMLDLMWLNNDPHALTVSIAYNYSATPTDVYVVTAAMMAAVTTPQMQWRFQPTNGKAQAIQVTVSDAKDAITAPTTFAGPTLISLRVEYGVKTTPSYYIPTAQRN